MSFAACLTRLFLGLIALCVQSYGQISLFPHLQNFDSVAVPLLPPGWQSTQNRTPGTNDFATTSSTVRTDPNAALSTNATIPQELISPVFSFAGEIPDSIVFYTRRSSSHAAKVVVEASLNGGASYTQLIGDTLLNTGSTGFVASRFELPAIVSTSSAVRFRWRIIPDASGNTGTFRIDDIRVSVKPSRDLELATIACTPLFPVEDDSITVRLSIANVGLQEASGFVASLFLDANHDSVAQQTELLANHTHAVELPPGDSVEISFPVGVYLPGSYPLIGRITYSSDRNPQNDQAIRRLGVGYRAGSIVVNEIMYAPTGTEPEWVELYNTRTDSISIKDWLVSDNVVTTRRLITTTSLKVPPQSYLLLTKDSAALIDIHPEIQARVIHIPGFPTLNNSGDAVVLYDNRAATMDSLSYLPAWGGNSGGKSLERIDPFAGSTTQSNWGTSRGSTPGRRNSLSRKDIDLRIDTILVSPVFPVKNDTLHFQIPIKNIGLLQTLPATVELYDDANRDSLAHSDELVGTQQVPLLFPLDSVIAPFQFITRHAGEQSFIVLTRLPDDEDTTNNVRVIATIIGYHEAVVRINEIMYAPSTGTPEWIELLNTSSDTVDLEDWTLSNRSATSRHKIESIPILLPPSSLLTITKDSALFRETYQDITGLLIQSTSLPTFLWNNSGDAAVVRDNRGLIMDSLYYFSTWGGTSGKSLERIDALQPNDSSNWGSSMDSIQASPGRVNSIVRLDNDLRILRAPPVLALPGEPAIISVTVENAGKLPSGQFDISLFHDLNDDSSAAEDERIARIHVTLPLLLSETTSVSFTWNEPPAGHRQVVALIEDIRDERLVNNRSFVNVRTGFPEHALVVNEIMYDPLSGQAEYVELFNSWNRDVDVSQWKLSDRPGSSGSVNSTTLSKARRIIHPGEFFIIGTDTNLLDLFPRLHDANPRLVLISNSVDLGLNNDGDVVLLKDLTGSVIDSVLYSPTWHNPGVHDVSGRSLERINPRLPANQARNWNTCTLHSGGTPGEQNSIYTSALQSLSSLACSPNPFSPDGDGMEDFSIIHYSLPLQVSMIRIRIFDVRGRLIRTLANNEPGGPQGDVVWDGKDDENQKARIGMYIVCLEAIDAQGGMLETAKSVVVVAAKL